VVQIHSPRPPIVHQKFKDTRIVVERMVPDQEVGGSNPLALATLSSRSHIDLHRNRFALFSHKTCPDLSINVCFCLVGSAKPSLRIAES
jgi:hypothetical protein